MKKILDGIDADDVPKNMKVSWEMRVKQLSVKSSTGHRWDPRFECLYS